MRDRHRPQVINRLLKFLSVIIWVATAASVRAEAWTGKINGCDVYIPDINKPIRAAMVNSLAFDDDDWRAVAKEYNCMMIQIVLNHWECPENARKIIATLKEASRQFPAHPEIQYTCVSLFGWSQTSAGACRVASQPELADRVVAVVAIHEIDTQPWLPPLSVPHLFISGQDDFYSVLKGKVEDATYTHDDAARNGATDEGAPLTMAADVNHGHVDVFGNYPFTRVWLEEVFKQRLPITPPMDAPVKLPGWRHHDGWLGTYDVAENTNTPPWGNEQRLINVRISPRASYQDSRKFTWLPSKRCAEVWQVYAEKGMMPAYGTLTPPTPVAPKIIRQPENLTVTPGMAVAIPAVAAGTPSPTYRWWRKGDSKKFVDYGPGDVLIFKPTVATTCYGMNDGAYSSTLPTERADWYRKAQKAVVQKFKAAGVRNIVVGTPGLVDTTTFRNPNTSAAQYNQTLGKLGDIAREVAKEEGVGFAEIHDAMMQVMPQAKAKYGQDYSVAGPDGVHPFANGHLIMAYAFLKALNVDGNIGTIKVDLNGNAATATDGHKILSSRPGQVEIESTRYPFCFFGDPKDPASPKGILQFLPFNRDLNRFMLVVTGIDDAATYRVTWGGTSKVFAGAQLSKGINLADEFMDNPFSAAFAKVDASVRRQQAFETPLTKVILHDAPAIKTSMPDQSEVVDALIRDALSKDKTLAEASAAALTPVRHVIQIERAE